MEPIRVCLRSTHFRYTTKARKRVLVPCGPTEKGAQPMDIWSVDPDALMPPPVDDAAFASAAEKMRKTITAQELERYHAFAADYGNALAIEGEGRVDREQRTAALRGPTAAQVAPPPAAAGGGGFFGWVRGLFAAPEAPSGPVRVRGGGQEGKEGGRQGVRRQAVPG